jgi:hypothetical protein
MLRMARDEWKRGIQLEVSAVLAHLRIPAGVLARLNATDRIEIETEDVAPIICLEIGDNAVALGQASERNGQLTAYLFWTGCQPCARRFDAWTLKKDTMRELPEEPGGNNAATTASPPSKREV